MQLQRNCLLLLLDFHLCSLLNWAKRTLKHYLKLKGLQNFSYLFHPYRSLHFRHHLSILRSLQLLREWPQVDWSARGWVVPLNIQPENKWTILFSIQNSKFWRSAGKQHKWRFDEFFFSAGFWRKITTHKKNTNEVIFWTYEIYKLFCLYRVDSLISSIPLKMG